MSTAWESVFNQIRRLDIVTPQGMSGTLARESRYVFNYATSTEESAVSLVMPIRQESYASGDLMGIFAMNRPEGYLRYIIEERLKRLGVPSEMFLLYLAGSNQIGRLTYTLAGQPLSGVNGEQLTTLLRSSSTALFQHLVDRYALGSGISGVQPKTLVPLIPSSPIDIHTSLPLATVIVKAEGLDFPCIARNEYLCLLVAKTAGLDVPDFWLSDDGLLFIMSRFDRRADGTAIGFEDMAVLTGRNSARKYEGSYEMIAKAVTIFAGEDSVRQNYRLFERVALSCKLRDGDAHLKNFGMVYDHPLAARKLAPVYDVVCTDIYPELDGKLALKLNKSKTFPIRANLLAYGVRLGLSHSEAEKVLKRLDDAFEQVCDALKDDQRYRKDELLTRIKNAVYAADKG
ncbi:MAG: type II toxin-antitoxin system HipA family toxin [Agitococcus sp.]|nr:type II toxin-antitoxin system HipA family toxin [Agitococcus sp.]